MAKKTTQQVLPQAPERINLLYVILGVAVLLTLIYMLAKSVKPFVNPENQNRTPVVLTDGQVNFESVVKGVNSNFGERVLYTINTEEEWGRLWNSMHAVMKPEASRTAGSINPVPELPKIDFEKEMLVIAFQGMQSTGGHAIEVTNIEKKDNVVGVTVKETSLGKECFTTQAITSPFHIVKIGKTDAKFEYDIKYEKRDCQ